MIFKKIMLSCVQMLMWLCVAIGVGMTALHAAKYAAITFYYYYGQHKLMEPIVQQEADSLNPANEGRLVQVHGAITAEQPLRDPFYGVETDAVRMERRVVGLQRHEEGAEPEDAPRFPPEPYLCNWLSDTPARIGCYTVPAAGLDKVKLRYGIRPVPSVMALPAELREKATPGDSSVVIRSENGFDYRVTFILGRENECTYLGRQQGSTLAADEHTLWRADFMEGHTSVSLIKALMNALFFSAAAWGAMVLALYALNKAMHRALSFRELSWYALLITLVIGFVFCDHLTSLGVLWSNPTLDHPWKAVRRVFIPEQLQAGRVAAAHAWLWGGIILCLAAAFLPALMRRMRRKR